MKIEVKAIEQIVEFDGEMVVIAPGKKGKLSQGKADQLEIAGKVKILVAKKKVEEEKPAPTGYAALNASVLANLATERGVMPETGSGKDDAVIKVDIIAALESDDEKTDYSTKDEAELIQMATELGVMPETGSGENGAVIKADIVAALEQADADSAPA